MSLSRSEALFGSSKMSSRPDSLLSQQSDPALKPCRQCQQIKPLIEFRIKRENRDGRVNRCKACERANHDQRLAEIDPSSPKTCRTCGESKPLGEFREAHRMLDGRENKCRVCRNAHHAAHQRSPEGWAAKENARLRKTFGITLAEYDAMLEAQGGVCPICCQPDNPMKGSGKVSRLAVDHDHTTGAVRGLLCATCNTAIGLLNDDPDATFRAFAYLKVNNRYPVEADPFT